MIPCSDNWPSFINEVLKVEFIPIISFTALVGLSLGFMKALLHFEAKFVVFCVFTKLHNLPDLSFVLQYMTFVLEWQTTSFWFYDLPFLWSQIGGQGGI